MKKHPRREREKELQRWGHPGALFERAGWTPPPPAAFDGDASQSTPPPPNSTTTHSRVMSMCACLPVADVTTVKANTFCGTNCENGPFHTTNTPILLIQPPTSRV